MSQPDLHGLRILVTRPLDRGEQFAAALANAGGEAILFPAMTIRARDREAVRAELRALASETNPLFIFVSGPAVTYGLQTVTEIFGEAGILRTAAVGAHTAALLGAGGCKEVVAPPSSNGSEALLRELEDLELGDRAVIILRGPGGRERLTKDLQARGARVSMLSVYERDQPDTDCSDIAQRFAQSGIDAVTVSSAEIFDNLLAMLDEGTRERLRKTPLLVPSRRVVTMVREKGATGPMILADGADDESMLAALARWRTTEPAIDGTGDEMMSEDKRPGAAEQGAEQPPRTEATVEAETQVAASERKPAPEKDQTEQTEQPARTSAGERSAGDATREEKVLIYKKSGGGIGALALLVALAAAAGSAYLWWLDRQAQGGSESIVRAIDQNTSRMQAEINALQGELAGLDDQFSDLLIDQQEATLKLGGMDDLNLRMQALARELEAMRGVSNSARRINRLAQKGFGIAFDLLQQEGGQLLGRIVAAPQAYAFAFSHASFEGAGRAFRIGGGLTTRGFAHQNLSVCRDCHITWECLAANADPVRPAGRGRIRRHPRRRKPLRRPDPRAVSHPRHLPVRRGCAWAVSICCTATPSAHEAALRCPFRGLASLLISIADNAFGQAHNSPAATARIMSAWLSRPRTANRSASIAKWR